MPSAHSPQMQAQLNRLKKLTPAQLRAVLVVLPEDPAPQWCKDLIRREVIKLLPKERA